MNIQLPTAKFKRFCVLCRLANEEMLALRQWQQAFHSTFGVPLFHIFIRRKCQGVANKNPFPLGREGVAVCWTTQLEFGS